MRKTLAALLITATALVGGPALAADSRTKVIERRDGTVEVRGDEDAVKVRQKNNGTLTVRQRDDNADLSVRQRGGDNQLKVLQKGDDNTLNVDQKGDSNRLKVRKRR